MRSSNYDIDILSFCDLAMDCAGECGGMAEIDECGICNGNGIINGTCDCDGNVLDCSGICGGDAIMDECEICDGPGKIYECGCNELSEGTCDCDGNILDCSGVCGGDNVPEPDHDCEGNMSIITYDMPYEFSLSNIYPNPFNPILNISYELPLASHTSIIIHDINGKKIMKINNGFQSSGNYSTIWDARNQASGVYLINLVNENNKSLTKIQKAILLK